METLDYEVLANKRNKFIDFVRGIAILFVLWGHAIQYSCLETFDCFDNKVFLFIYSFHMPLFMMVSGYLFYVSFTKRPLKELLIHRTQNLLQPIIIWGLIYYYTATGPKIIVHREWESLFSGAWLPTIRGYWFLWSILGAAIPTSIAFKSSRKGHGFSTVIILCGMVFASILPNCANNLYLYPYFIIGFLCSKYKDRIKCLRQYRYLTVLLFIGLLFFFQKEHLIYVSGLYSFQIDVFRWIIGLLGSISVIVVCFDLVHYLTARDKINLAFIRYISTLGQYSLHIYILQRILLENYYAKLYYWVIGGGRCKYSCHKHNSI